MVHRKNKSTIGDVIDTAMSNLIKQTLNHVLQAIGWVVLVELMVATRWRMEVALDYVLGAYQFFKIEVGKVDKFLAVGQSAEGKTFQGLILGEVGKFTQPRIGVVLPKVI